MTTLGLSLVALSGGYYLLWAFLVAQMIKNLLVVQETWVRSLGWEDPGRRAWQRTPVFLPGEFHGHESLVGYSSWGLKKVGHNSVTKQQHEKVGSYLFFGPHCGACRISLSRPGIKPGASAVKVWSPNHWATREFPLSIIFNVLECKQLKMLFC